MSDAPQFFAKEISWLAFNERVLQEAEDVEVPIIERVRFLGIFSNNMDEFFRVRVADVRRELLISEAQRDSSHKKKLKDKTAHKLMKQIQHKVKDLYARFDEAYREVSLKLARHKIFLIDEKKLGDFHEQWLKEYFHNKVLRHISPIMINDSTDLNDVLNENTTYLWVAIRTEQHTRYCMIEIPTHNMSRFLLLPTERTKTIKKIILLDDIICHFMEDIFEGLLQFDSIEAYSFKMTRDSEYNLTDEIDTSLLEKMSDSMKQRLSGEPVRYVYDNQMPEDMVEYLSKLLKLTSQDSLLAGTRYRNFKDFIGFPNVGRKYLENKPMPALTSQDFRRYPTVFEAIRTKDILLYYPYHRFLHFSEMLRQATFDPAVTSISLNIYRVANKSRIIKSLVDAVKNGKKVTVIVELRARFDEENNIEWSKMMTEAGIKVQFGIPNLKIHSKLCLITRQEDGKPVRYAHLGTGNFNEKTAKIYTDFSLFTCHKEICQEVANVFEFIEHSYKRFRFNHLLISPLNCRKRLYQLIDQEIEFAERGKKAEIILKINNLVDEGLIQRLYKASNGGVKVRMIIRGMCSLVPGIEGQSENISVISIVDRFLEHPRVMVFNNGGSKQVFISSADWMTRNIENRVEVGCPIYSPELKKRIIDILNIQFADTTKARIVDKQQQNHYVRRGRKKKIRSQVAIYDYLKDVEANIAAKAGKHLG